VMLVLLLCGVEDDIGVESVPGGCLIEVEDVCVLLIV